jgi:hypothetical protein
VLVDRKPDELALGMEGMDQQLRQEVCAAP